MNYFSLAIRNLFIKRQNNLIKILSLGTGLAVGLVIISKFIFENSFDDFFPDKDHIYLIQSNIIRADEAPVDFPQVSGAIAPGMKSEVPGIEAATRYTYIAKESTFFTPDKKRYQGTFILADSSFFDLFPRTIITGNAKEILSQPMQAMIAKSTAKKIEGSPIGKTIELDIYPGREVTISGIFEDIPENSHLNFTILISLPSINNFTWDGSENWLGNNRYLGYVKLLPSTHPDNLQQGIRKMQEKYQDIQQVEKSGRKY